MMRIDSELIGINNVAERWAKADRQRPQLHPLEAMRLMHDGAVLGGGPRGIADDVAAFDEVYSKAPKATQQTIKVWYCNGLPVNLKAERLRVSRATLYARWREALRFMHGGLWVKGFRV
jgi:hypothetical protein